MKVLSIIEPWASLIANGKKVLKQEVGKLHIGVSYIFMQVRKRKSDSAYTRISGLNA